MSTGLVYDERFLDHHPGPGHPERPDRLRAVVGRLRDDGLWDRCDLLPVKAASLDDVLAVHDAAYLRRVESACVNGEASVDCADCSICPSSYAVALLAAGGVVSAVDAVMAGRCDNAFCAVRPPGHHAERDHAMGFCFINHIAVAAERLIRHHRLQRVAIVDFDVHHGNGTQHTFEARDDVLFISLHEHPSCLYPGTGYETETGTGAGEGYTLNLPIMPGGGDEVYMELFRGRVLPTLKKFQPQFLLLSAGFDAARGDPLAHLQVTAEGFTWMTHELKSAAGELCGGKLVSILEGGYALESLAQCAAVHLQSLLQPEGYDHLMAYKIGM